MNQKDSLGDRMKESYERRAVTKLPRRTNVIFRIDGRAFHTFTKNFAAPYADDRLMSIMDWTARRLCKEVSGTKLAFVQSDEISLWVTDYDTIETQPWFDYEVQKMCSCAASFATSEFTRAWLGFQLAQGFVPAENIRGISKQLDGLMPTFDCRVFCIPDPVEVHNYFVWRQKDAERNALLMIGTANFGHKEMQGVNPQGVAEKMAAKYGQNWGEPINPGFMRGRIIVKNPEDGWRIVQSYPRFVEDHQIIGSRVPCKETNETNTNNPERSVVA